MMSHGAVSVITNIFTHLNSPLLLSANPPLPSEDDLLRIQLESSHAKEFHWLIYATVAVIVGVIFEEIDVILKILNITTERLAVSRIGTIVVPRFELLPWVRRIARIAWIVLVAGLVAEIIFESDISELDTDAEIVSGSEIQAARGEAADAIERAAKIEQENIKLQIDLVQVKRSAGQRYLSADEQNQLVKELAKYHVSRVPIWCKLSNSEASKFGDDFEKVFTRLHWNPSRSYVADSNVQVVGKNV